MRLFFKLQRVLIVLTLVFSANLLACNSSQEQVAQKPEAKKVVKQKIKFLLLTQDSDFEMTLAKSAQKGLEAALEFIATQESGFAETEPRVEFAVISPAQTLDQVVAEISESVAVFAVLDMEHSYLLAQALENSPVPLIFLNDGPMRTCKYNDPNTVSATFWQTGLTDSQVMEPFLIHLAEKLKSPKDPFRFSFFSSRAIREEIVTDTIVENVEALGFDVVEEQTLDIRISDFYKTLRRLLRSRADVLFLSVLPDYTTKILQQSAKMLIYKDFSLAMLWLLPEEKLGSLSENATEVRTVSRYSREFNSSIPDKDKEIWTHKASTRLVTAMQTTSYITMQLLQKAALKAGGFDPTSLNAGLLLVSLATPQSSVWFNKENHVLLQSLFSVVASERNYQKVKYLGDIDHPRLEGCSHSVLYDIEQQEKAPPVPKYQ